MKKLLMLVGDFVEDYEVMVPYQMMLLVGHEVDAVCPGKKKGEYVQTAIHDFDGYHTYSEKPGHRFLINADFSKAKAAKYDGLIIPGGRSPEYLRLEEKVLSLVQDFAKAKKPIAAICHGPHILAAAGLLSGRTCQAYPTLKPEVELAGGKWDKPSAGFDNVTVDGNLVTASAWPAHPAWMRAFLKVLGTPVGK